jgi:hypothetical protein
MTAILITSVSAPTGGSITTENEVPQRLLTLVVCSAALLDVSVASQAVGGAAVQMDGPALITKKIRPGDGSERVAAFARVRRAMLSAARRNDLDAVVRYFAPQLHCYTAIGLMPELGFMTGEECAAQLRADPDEARDFLSNLQRALEIGTAFEGQRIVAPYVAVSGDIIYGLPDIPDGRYLVVAADRVRARAAPSTRAPVVEVLSYDIVALVDRNAAATQGAEPGACDYWALIATPKKRQAWVCWKYLADPLDDIIFAFQRQPDGEWKLVSVYAPD